MVKSEILGGTRPALAAHSKDGSAVGPTPASEATGNNQDQNSMSDTLNYVAKQAQDGAKRAAASVQDFAENAAHSASRQSHRAVDGGTQIIRGQPLLAIAATGIAGFILGALLSRR